MRFARVALGLPVLAFLKLAACGGTSGDPIGAAPGGPDAGTPDGTSTIPDSSAGPDGGTPDANKSDAATDTGTDAPIVPSQCKVTKGTAGITYKGTLLLPDSVVEAGELMVSAAGIIACAAKDCSATAGYGATSVVACEDVVISPGLINPHDHISFANVPPKATTERYEQRHDWRKGMRGHTKISTTPVPKVPNAVRAAELRFVMSGATSAVSSGGEKGLLRNLDGAAAALEGLKVQSAKFDTFPLGDSTPKLLASGCDYPSRTTTASIAGYEGYFPHISEGIDKEAHNEMVCQNTAVGPDGAFDLIQRQTAVIHGIAVTAQDVALFRSQKAALVWSPRSNVSLYGATAPVVMYDNLGVQIALGTDWLPSGSMNMQRELKCADELNQNHFNKHFTDKQLWTMVTTNAAMVAGVAQLVGELKVGFVADVAIFNSKVNKQYRSVIDAGPEDVLLVTRGGKALYGDTEILDGLDGQDCEALPVCGSIKKACVKKDTGTALVDVMTDAAAVYPLFFCKGQPMTNEPSCAPIRADFKSGSMGSTYAGVTATDKDGDGIADADDLCPTVFSPIRPMDSAVQADSDTDGIGDACDKCPLESGEACTPPSSNDLDGDSVINPADNCPEDANADQADGDSDGKGDICDKCPTEPNAGATSCTLPFTVEELRNPALATHPAPGSVRAKIVGVEVTAVKNVGTGDQGFFVQQLGVATFGGLFVAMPSPTVSVGNIVDVVGDYSETFGLTYLSAPTITVTDPKTTLTTVPQLVPLATLANVTAGEPYEGMLVLTGAVTVVTQNPDAPKDFDELEVTGPLRIDDYVFDALDNTYPVATPFSQITAIAGFSFAQRKLWPRSAADLVP